MNQKYSVFMPGLTARGPVYAANSPLGAYLSGLPALPSVAIYGLMAASLFAGYKKMLPFGIAGGAGVAAAIYFLFPNSDTSGSGAPTAANISAATAGAATIDTTALTNSINDSVAAMTPSLSGFFNPSKYNRRVFRTR